MLPIPTSVNILVVEDDAKKRAEYVAGINDAEQSSIRFAVREAGTAEEAIGIVRRAVVPFVWLDQRLPASRSSDERRDDQGLAVAEAISQTQRLHRTTVFTSFPNWKLTREFSRLDAEYFDSAENKGGASANVRSFLDGIQRYLHYRIWRDAAVGLPSVLGEHCFELCGDAQEAGADRLLSATALWETGMRMWFLSSLSMCMQLGGNTREVLNAFTRRMDNGPILSKLPSLVHEVAEGFEKRNLRVARREYVRFFSDEGLFEAMRGIQSLRNHAMHSPPKVMATTFEENIGLWIRLLFGLSFWSLHPLVGGVRILGRDGRNVAEGTPFWGKGFLDAPARWQWDGALVADPKKIVQVVVDPENRDQAVSFCLHPLIRFHPNRLKNGLWFAHQPFANEYRNPLTGDREKFPDDDLSEWWRRAADVAQAADVRSGADADTDGSGRADGTETIPPVSSVHGSVAEKTGKTGKGRLSEAFVACTRSLYVGEGSNDTCFDEKDYQAGFSGEEKAKDVLKYLASIPGFDFARSVYVSVGGGNGSEIYCALHESAIASGVLVEYSQSAVEMAKARAIDLRKEGKTLTIISGDATQRQRDCVSWLRGLKARSDIDGVVATFQSILHELPYRSPNYNLNYMLGSLFRAFSRRVFYAREPTTPIDWPENVVFRLRRFDGDLLHGLCRQVRDVFGIGGQVEELADGYVLCSKQLATEVLFKVLYCREPERYRYEMEEQLTGFDPGKTANTLSLYIQPRENVDISYLATDTFRKLYSSIGVEARDEENNVLPIPKTFARVAGWQQGG